MAMLDTAEARQRVMKVTVHTARRTLRFWAACALVAMGIAYVATHGFSKATWWERVADAAQHQVTSVQKPDLGL